MHEAPPATPVLAPENGPLPTGKAARLRALLARPGLTVAAQCQSAEHAAIARHVGVDCIYAGGSFMARTGYLFEDNGMLLPSEMVEIAGRIARAVDIPLIADADQGGETPLNTLRMVRDLCRAEVAGCHIEDTLNPKHMRWPQHRDTTLDRLISVEEMVVRIEAAREARALENRDIVLIARTDAIFNQRGNPVISAEAAEAETIRRGIAYAEAGADVFMVQSMALDQIDRIAAEVPIPLCDDVHPIAEVRKTRLKLYLALTNNAMILNYIEAITRDLKDHDDYDHSRFPVPQGSYRLQDFTNHALTEALGAAWVAARDKARPG